MQPAITTAAAMDTRLETVRGDTGVVKDALAGRAPTRERLYLRSDLKAARSSSHKSWGCSHAAKWPPRSSLL
jgi:hypothetical protein